MSPHLLKQLPTLQPGARASLSRTFVRNVLFFWKGVEGETGNGLPKEKKTGTQKGAREQ